MIRHAQKEDFGELARMGAEFARRASSCPFHADSFIRTVIAMMTGAIGAKSALFVIDDGRAVGMFGISIYPCWFNAEYLIAQEIVWWVDEQARGRDSIRLFEHAQQWARENGARLTFMGIRTRILAQDSRVESGLRKFYARRGYAPWETIFGKFLDGDSHEPTSRDETLQFLDDGDCHDEPTPRDETLQ